ncbi:unnamed protein product [Adineta steineri]|uniref:ATPase AAA-type core domain-containing protein n=1 Tax=Adineta steineri TaxID=433720 RepID=A0A814VL37_9BILA|nr:unnamed protein product [Adineta steineri]CAF1436218.1 unnamed protein product [Adineta steineri]
MLGNEESTVNKQTSDPKYVGNLPDMPLEALVLYDSSNDRRCVSSVRLFLTKYRKIPCVLYCLSTDNSRLLHSTSIFNHLRDELKHDLDTDHIMGTYNYETDQMDLNSTLSDLGNGIMIEMNEIYLIGEVQNPNKLKPDNSANGFLIASRLHIYYLPEHAKYVQELAKSFKKMMVMTVEPSKVSTLQMVCKNQYGYYLSAINIKKPVITDLALHYGKNFVSIHNTIIKSFNKKEEKGIVLLHGIPGSGKTHYIRYLIHEVEEKMLIYVPPDMAKEISSPEFLPFLMQYQNSILIIEDAENIIKDRNESTTPSQAVANLLNLSDGLLGDAMHQQILATFNCDLTTIDPALLRKGRLIANYEFNKLDIESSKILSDKLGFGIEHINESMTLAEIYNHGESKEQNEEEVIIKRQTGSSRGRGRGGHYCQ